MVLVRYGARSQVSYDWTPAVAYPFGKGHKPCGMGNPDVMFPDPTDTESHELALMACGLCDVLETCLEHALAQPASHDHGIWGGTTREQRIAIRRSRSREAKAAKNDPKVRPRPFGTHRPWWAGPAFLPFPQAA